jgi:hypothetical protein
LVKLATYLATRRLGEPESPCVQQRVLDVEVIGVVEHGADLIVGAGFLLALVRRGAVDRRDGNGVQRDLLVL